MNRYELRIGVYKDVLFDNEEQHPMPFYEDFIVALLNQQDDKIKELENINKKLNLENQKLYEELYCDTNNKRLAIERIKELEKELKVHKKALELAVEKVAEYSGDYWQESKDYIIQAREELEKEDER